MIIMSHDNHETMPLKENTIMAFKKTIMLGLKSALDSLTSTIKSWCNTTFAPKSHTHPVSQITGLSSGSFPPVWNKQHGRNFNTTYTESVDGYLIVFCAEGWNCYWVYLTIGNMSSFPIYRGVGDNYGCGSSICVPVKAGTSYKIHGSKPSTFNAYFIPAS